MWYVVNLVTYWFFSFLIILTVNGDPTSENTYPTKYLWTQLVPLDFPPFQLSLPIGRSVRLTFPDLTTLKAPLAFSLPAACVVFLRSSTSLPLFRVLLNFHCWVGKRWKEMGSWERGGSRHNYL